MLCTNRQQVTVNFCKTNLYQLAINYFTSRDRHRGNYFDIYHVICASYLTSLLIIWNHVWHSLYYLTFTLTPYLAWHAMNSLLVVGVKPQTADLLSRFYLRSCIVLIKKNGNSGEFVTFGGDFVAFGRGVVDIEGWRRSFIYSLLKTSWQKCITTWTKLYIYIYIH